MTPHSAVVVAIYLALFIIKEIIVPMTSKGFKPEATTIKLNFKDTDLDGLVITIKSVSVKKFNAMMADTRTGAEGAESNKELIELFLEKLVSWNLLGEDEEPLPHTVEAVESLESNLFTRIVIAWQQGMTTVPTTSRQPSTGGSPPSRSAESTLGLDSLSESPGSLLTPG